MSRLLLSIAAALALCACSPPAAVQVEVAQVADVASDVVAEAQGALADPVEDAQRNVVAVLVPAVVAVHEVLVEALPAPSAPATSAATLPSVSPAAVALIVGFEIISPAYYTKRLQSPVYPGGASGATIGIGYDLGHQARGTIAADWAGHPQLDRLLPAAGVMGAPARQLVRSMRDVRTPLVDAERVFQSATLPTYDALTARAFPKGWDTLPANASGSLTATVYNRGASMRGERRREMRELRDACVPAGDTACMAAQYRSMCRLWLDTATGVGLCRRYEATAKLAELRA